MDYSLEQQAMACKLDPETACRKHKINTSFDTLPSEIILEILSRTPFESVLRCRSVSKTWRSIIDHPSLINLHMLNSASAVKKHHLLLLSDPSIATRRWENTRLFSLKDHLNIFRATQFPIAQFVDACRFYISAINLGILIFRNTHHKGQSFLFNPCRGEVLTLPQATVLAPPRETELEHYGFGFDSTTNAYKVVRVFTWNIQMINPRDYVSEVYTLGTRSWRPISSVFPYYVNLMPISAYGDIHWMIYGGIPEGSAEGMIISFDCKTEEFKLTPHPDFPCKIYEYFRLFELRGSLAILDISPSTHMEIWVLKDYERKEWAQEYKISIELWRRETQLHLGVSDFKPEPVRVVGAWEEGLLFQMLAWDYRFFYCNLITGSLRHIRCITPTAAASTKPCGYVDNSYIYPYMGSLVSLGNHGNLMVKELGTENCFDLTTVGMDSVKI